MKKTTGKTNNPVSNCLLIVANRNTRKRCDICSNLAIKTAERRHVNGVILMSLSLTLNLFYTFSGRSRAGEGGGDPGHPDPCPSSLETKLCPQILRPI